MAKTSLHTHAAAARLPGVSRLSCCRNTYNFYLTQIYLKVYSSSFTACLSTGRNHRRKPYWRQDRVGLNDTTLHWSSIEQLYFKQQKQVITGSRF